MKFHDGAAVEPLKQPPERLITETAESLGERLNSVFSALFIFLRLQNKETRRRPPRRLKGSSPEGGAVSLRALFNFVSAWRGTSCPTGWNNTACRAARERKSVSAPWERNVRDKEKTQEEPQSGGGSFFSISMQRRGESEAGTRPASKCRKWKL